MRRTEDSSKSINTKTHNIKQMQQAFYVKSNNELKVISNHKFKLRF